MSELEDLQEAEREESISELDIMDSSNDEENREETEVRNNTQLIREEEKGDTLVSGIPIDEPAPEVSPPEVAEAEEVKKLEPIVENLKLDSPVTQVEDIPDWEEYMNRAAYTPDRRQMV